MAVIWEMAPEPLGHVAVVGALFVCRGGDTYALLKSLTASAVGTSTKRVRVG